MRKKGYLRILAAGALSVMFALGGTGSCFAEVPSDTETENAWEEGENQPDRDVEFVEEDAENSRVRDYTSQVGAVYPKEMLYEEVIPNVLTLSTEYGARVTVENITPALAYNEDPLTQVLDNYVSNSVQFEYYPVLFGHDGILGETLIREEKDEGAERKAVLEAIIEDPYQWIRIRSALYKLSDAYGMPLYIVKTIYLNDESDFCEPLWKRVGVFGCSRKRQR